MNPKPIPLPGVHIRDVSMMNKACDLGESKPGLEPEIVEETDFYTFRMLSEHREVRT